jgi:hypothetical protein
MAELADMRKRILQVLRPLDAVPVENRVGPGHPDVNTTICDIELKWLRSWPKRPETKVELKHFTPQQRLWLKRRERRGGCTWVLLQCKREWLLFDGTTAAELLGRCTRSELLNNTHRAWLNGLDGKELIECLLSRRAKPCSSSAADTASGRPPLLNTGTSRTASTDAGSVTYPLPPTPAPQ